MIDSFPEWCLEMGGAVRKDNDEFVCEIDDASHVTVKILEEGPDYTSIGWIQREDKEFTLTGLENGHPKDAVIYREGDTVVVEGKTEYHGRGDNVRVEFSGDVNVASSDGMTTVDHLRQK